MHERFLLDTDAASASLRFDRALIARLATASEIVLPSIVLGELYSDAFDSGARYRHRGIATVELHDAMAASNAVIACDSNTAWVYGRIVADLESRGQRIPEHDMWIAAPAIQHTFTLLTRDAHFDRIAGRTIARR
jgi:tRNA(fMet)-specific endonuclease VapC